MRGGKVLHLIALEDGDDHACGMEGRDVHVCLALASAR
jgi:hypothetical protein